MCNFEDNPSQVEVVPEQSQPNISDLVSEYVFLNDESAAKSVEETASVVAVNGDESAELNGSVDDDRPPQNGAEAYENLVKSLTECDTDYMKDIAEDAQMDESFGLIDSNILESFSFTRESGLFQ